MRGILVVVPCGRRKIWSKYPNQGATSAQHAYVGAPFRVNIEYAKAFAERCVILSAKYGFISPEFLIPRSYNVTFKNKSTNPISVLTMQEQISAQNLDCFEIVIVLGGKVYRDMVKEVFASSRAKVCFPFVGIPIGKMMRATKQAIALGEPFPELGSGK